MFQYYQFTLYDMALKLSIHVCHHRQEKVTLSYILQEFSPLFNFDVWFLKFFRIFNLPLDTWLKYLQFLLKFTIPGLGSYIIYFWSYMTPFFQENLITVFQHFDFTFWDKAFKFTIYIHHHDAVCRQFWIIVMDFMAPFYLNLWFKYWERYM